MVKGSASGFLLSCTSYTDVNFQLWTKASKCTLQALTILRCAQPICHSVFARVPKSTHRL